MLIMFDMDGTLIDTQSLIAEHMATAFETVGMTAPPPHEVRRIIGLSLPIAMERLARTDDQSLIFALCEHYREHYRASLLVSSDREPLFPGARAALDRLHEQPEMLLGIATGKGLTGVERILANHELSGRFITLQTPDHNPSKPHPGMLLRAMAETGSEKSETVMVGDTSFDMELAKSAGAAAIGVTWGYHEAEELLSAGADVLIDSYDDLDAAICQLLE